MFHRDWYVQMRNRRRRQAVEGGDPPPPSNGLLTGLLGYYALNEAGVTDNALDSSSNVRDLTQTNSPQVGTGKLLGCRVFNGATNSRRFTSTDAAFAVTDDFTIAGWFRHAVVGAAQAYVSKHDTNNQRSYKIRATAANAVVLILSTSGTADTTISFSGLTLTTAQWYFFCARRTGSTAKISVTPDNESSVRSDSTGSVSGALFASTSPFCIGTGFGSGAVLDPMNGDVDEVGIWNAHLSDTQVGLLFGGGTPLGFGGFS